MNWITALILAVAAVTIGYGVGRMHCWKTWQGYAGLMIVAPLGIMTGVPWPEIVINCAGFGTGFTLARR